MVISYPNFSERHNAHLNQVELVIFLRVVAFRFSTSLDQDDDSNDDHNDDNGSSKHDPEDAPIEIVLSGGIFARLQISFLWLHDRRNDLPRTVNSPFESAGSLVSHRLSSGGGLVHDVDGG